MSTIIRRTIIIAHDYLTFVVYCMLICYQKTQKYDHYRTIIIRVRIRKYKNTLYLLLAWPFIRIRKYKNILYLCSHDYLFVSENTKTLCIRVLLTIYYYKIQKHSLSVILLATCILYLFGTTIYYSRIYIYSCIITWRHFLLRDEFLYYYYVNIETPWYRVFQYTA